MLTPVVPRLLTSALRPSFGYPPVAAPSTTQRAFSETSRALRLGPRGHRPRSYTRLMCGRFTLTEESAARVAAQLGMERDELFEESYTPRWNIAPTQPFWIVTAGQEARRVQPATWGLVNWSEASRREGAKHINARAESLTSRRPYREAFASARCVQ